MTESTAIVTIPVDFSHQAIIEIKPELDTSIADLQDEIVAFLRCASLVIIDSSDAARSVTEDIALAGGLAKTLEAKRNEWLKPLREHTEQINDTFKKLSEPLKTADRLLRDKVIAYQKLQAKIQQDARDLAELERQAQLKRDSLLRQTGEIIDAPIVPKIIVPEMDTKHINSDLATAGSTTNWKWEVTDFKALPDEFKIPDAAKLSKVVRAGMRTIAGVKIYPEQGIRVTTRR